MFSAQFLFLSSFSLSLNMAPQSNLARYCLDLMFSHVFQDYSMNMRLNKVIFSNNKTFINGYTILVPKTLPFVCLSCGLGSAPLAHHNPSANTKPLEGKLPSPFLCHEFHWVCLMRLWTGVHSLTNSLELFWSTIYKLNRFNK